MSTKTNFKRVALVAVASLGLGVLTSVAPANAAFVAGEVTATTAAAGVNTTLLCAAGTLQDVAKPATIAVGGTYQFTIDGAGSSGDDGRAVISGPADWSAAGTNSAWTVDSTGQVLDITSVDTALALALKVTGAGAIQVAFYNDDSAAGTLIETYYLTAVTSCSSGVNAAKSHVQVSDSAANTDTAAEWIARQTNTTTDAAAFLATTNQDATSMDTSLDVRTLFANDASAYIALEANDAYGVAVAGPLLGEEVGVPAPVALAHSLAVLDGHGCAEEVVEEVAQMERRQAR
jgi:hypothetical protein